MPQVVALLRGINLGRTNRVSMATLRALLEDLGYDDVRTHLQSGNAIFATRQRPDAVARAIEQGITERIGLSIDVIVRTEDELAAIVDADPLRDVATDGSKHFVVFLSREVDAAALRELAELDLEPERVAARGRAVYVWCPNGMRDSRAMKALNEHPLAPTATVRNWNTVTRLLAMVRPSG
jgi:uncharacterized protein (DUF1697 family)